MFDEDSPVFRGSDRNRTFSFHTLNKLNQFGCSVLLPEHGFIAHDQALDIGIVSGEVEGCCDLTLVSGIVGTDPGAKRDVKPEFSRNLWHPLEPLGGSISAYRLGLPGDGREIGPNPRLGHFPSRRRESPRNDCTKRSPACPRRMLPLSPDFSAPRLQDGCKRPGRERRPTCLKASHGFGPASMPTNSPLCSISSAVFMSAPCGAHNV